MADERLKVEMLRFVDVFPTLRSRPEIARHLREYFAREGVAAPAALRWGISLTGQRSPVAPLASAVIRSQMKGFAQRFIVGRDARGAIPALRALRRDGIGFTLDVLGEATVSEAEGRRLPAHLPRPPRRPRRRGRLVAPRPRDRRGRLGAAPARQPQPQDHLAVLADRPRRLRRQRRRRQGPAAARSSARPSRRGGAHARPRAVPLPRPDARGLHVAPRRGRVPRLPRRRRRRCRRTCATPTRTSRASSTWARERGRPFNLRLVKGAYWDYETVIAAQEGWPVPVFTHKPDTDAMYERLHAGDAARPRTSSGRRSPATTCARWRSPSRPPASLGLPRDAFELQMLHGMGDPIKAAVRRHGPAPARVRAGGRAHPRHGVPRAPAAREHGQRLVPAADVRRGGGRRRARAAARDRRPTSARGPRRLPAVDADRPAGARRPSATSRTPTSRAARTARRTTRRWRAARSGLGAHYPLRIGGRDIETARTLDVGEPRRAGRGDRHGRLRRPRRGRGRRRGGARGAAGVAGRRAGRARRRAVPRRRAACAPRRWSSRRS